jgi:hypothetical protein
MLSRTVWAYLFPEGHVPDPKYIRHMNLESHCVTAASAEAKRARCVRLCYENAAKG